MENLRLFLHLLLLSSAAFFCVTSGDTQRRYVSVLVDCGALRSTSFNDSDSFTREWLADGNFTNAGETFLFNSSGLSYPMNTLRFFPSGRRNCYKLPFWNSGNKYLFRAGFHYGNYDGLSRPPRFSLTIDGHIWAAVETSMSQETVYYELIYKIKKEDVRVCLERTVEDDDDVPFISSLEGVYMYNEMYRLMENDTALLLHDRTNYGANQTIDQLIGQLEECCGRVWKHKEMMEYDNKHADGVPDGSSFGENLPPWPVMATAIQAKSNNMSLRLPANFSTQVTTAYFVLYFKDISFFENQTGSVDIYIDNTKYDENVDIPGWFGNSGNSIRVVTLYPIQVNGSATTVTISPANGTSIPPLLNAMEVFSAVDVSKAGGEFLVVARCYILLYLAGLIVYWSILAT